jgi:membrane peptidoglycan carboxypeptidase
MQHAAGSTVCDAMPNKKIYHEPSSVTAEDGDVLVEGPDDVDVALSPEAAEETSNRLLENSMKARGQRHLNHYPHRPKSSSRG